MWHAVLSRIENSMDANLFFSATTPFSKAGLEPAPGTPPTEKTLGGVEFNALVSDYLQGHQRQELAALGSAGAVLQVQPLGPEIDLITTGAPLPDLGSLAAFARAQGLDESAVKLLFGNIPVEPNASAAFSMPVSAPAITAALPMSWAPGSASVPATTPDQAMAMAWRAQPDWAPLAVRPTSPVILTSEGDALAKSPLTEGDALTSAALMATLQPGLPMAASHQAVTLPSSMTRPAEQVSALQTPGVAIAGGQNMPAGVSVVALQVGPKKSLTLPTPPLNMEGAEASASDAAMTEAFRFKLDASNQDITRQLAQMSGTAKQTTWGTLTMDAAATQLLQSLSLLGAKDLKPGMTANLALATEQSDAAFNTVGEAGTDSPLTSSLDFNASTSLKGQSEAAAPGSTTNAAVLNQQRSEQYQQLADRLGEAVGQRLINQIKQGDWKLQLRMQPASLGQIDIELDMHKGGLDALFMSDTQSTRELLAQGMNKLKDALAQTGMPVASVWVNGEQSRQSGGNPTPGREPQFVSRVTNKDEDISVSTLSARPVRLDPNKGWDVLA
jgi:flagellar hook-length control protein FliK